jgi:hypothetical protein
MAHCTSALLASRAAKELIVNGVGGSPNRSLPRAATHFVRSGGRYWPEATETDVRFHVGDRSKSGLVVLNVSFAESDPADIVAA